MTPTIDRLYEDIMTARCEAARHSMEVNLTIYVSPSFHHKIKDELRNAQGLVRIDNPHATVNEPWRIGGYPIYPVVDYSGTHPDVSIMSSGVKINYKENGDASSDVVS